MEKRYKVVIIGGGPAGLAAAAECARLNVKNMLIEREPVLGGILKQCIHDGFGIIRFGEKLSGPEYAERYIDMLTAGTDVRLSEFVTGIKKIERGFELTSVSPCGVKITETDTIVLATGCRERTSRQVGITGDFPAGVFTAGTAQYYTNVLGKRVGKKAVILGSGDIGLIMARRLTLEGTEVKAVYEIKPTPSGLNRNIQQCLNDFNIPLILGHTVTRLFGKKRLEAVEVSAVDGRLNPIGRPERVECDTLILSVGLIPENEIAEKLGVELSPATKGALVDQSMMTSVPGVFACGNALHVNDLADYVSESAVTAAAAAAVFDYERPELTDVEYSDNMLYLVPQRLDGKRAAENTIFYFRSRGDISECRLTVTDNGREIFKRSYMALRPPEMERVVLKGAVRGRLKFTLDEKSGGGEK
ncbi:MAG: NAD(P)/FAD-dependent oxidoreductase [Clostridiales bacterium]|jgi:thioredoxin reductase|nr:NAD(P)/FAD-dependent oxidoreductase [Clostridiales bacterium]